MKTTKKLTFRYGVLVYAQVLCCLLLLQSVAFAAEQGKEERGKNPVVLLKTSEGSFKVELWADKAPETVKNFLRYVDEGYYNGTIFHRVIPIS